jgi:phage replication initiation protein
MESPFSSWCAEAAEVAAAATPRADARGGADAATLAPRTVIRGESHGEYVPGLRAIDPVRILTDWLNITFPFSGTEDALEAFVQGFTEATEERLGGMTSRERGLHGYSNSFAFDRGGALFACGGQRFTGFLSLSSEACALVPDWARLVRFGRDTLSGRITRWDGAIDDFYGAYSVDVAVNLYLSGEFNAGGRCPSYNQVGPWLAPGDGGRTFYVGNRKNGKLLRVYEKGRQLGFRSSAWTRWEVEFHNIDRVVPWEVLLRPDEYLAGAYPCMQWVGDKRSRIQAIKAQDEMSYGRHMESLRRSYGPMVHEMLRREGNSDRVVAMLSREGVPRRLAFSTEYLREHGDEADI